MPCLSTHIICELLLLLLILLLHLNDKVCQMIANSFLIPRYKWLQGELAASRDTLIEVMKGKQILHSINCPSLETTITELAQKWLSLNTKLTDELKRWVLSSQSVISQPNHAKINVHWLHYTHRSLNFRCNILFLYRVIKNRHHCILDKLSISICNMSDPKQC